MADIIVQNGINKVASAVIQVGSNIDYVTLLGESLASRLTAIINANTTIGSPYYSTIATTKLLCDLSSAGFISKCTCSYSGSGSTYPGQTGTQVWTSGEVLKGGAFEKSLIEISGAFKNLDTELNNIATIEPDRVNLDLYTEYYSLKSTFSDTTILGNWYGVGADEVQGAALSSTNRIKVCGTDWASGEGGTCTWTVPAGATRAKFQVWGAGVGTNPGCCCGGSPFGTTGAYSEMFLNVTPGETYTACSGCSCSIYCCSNTLPGPACNSGVTGPGICCLIAKGQGACSAASCNNMNFVRCEQGSGGACYRYQSIYCTNSSGCWCSNNEYCYDNSCETCGTVSVIPSCCGDMTTYCSCSTLDSYCVTDGDGAKRGHRGIYGGGCLDQNNYGFHNRPPIIDADTGLEYPKDSGCYLMTFTSGTSCGGCNGKDWAFHPGHGGAGNHIMGGTNDHKGDTGKAGMVQISWI